MKATVVRDWKSDYEVKEHITVNGRFDVKFVITSNHDTTIKSYDNGDVYDDDEDDDDVDEKEDKKVDDDFKLILFQTIESILP